MSYIQKCKLKLETEGNFGLYHDVTSLTKDLFSGQQVEYTPDFIYKYMIFDNNKMCLHNVLNKQVGMTYFEKKLAFELESEQMMEYAQDFKDSLVEYCNELKDVVDFVDGYKRSQPSVETAFASIKKFYPTLKSTSKTVLGLQSFREAAEMLQNQISKLKINVVDEDDMLNNAIDYLTEKSASAGLPYAIFPHHSKKDVLQNASFKSEFTGLLEAARHGGHLGYRAFTSPCVAYQKSAVIHKDDEEKVRLIWGYPLAMVLMEGMFAIPTIEECKKAEMNGDFLTAYQFGPFSDFHEKYVCQKMPVVVRDFSTYDSTVPEVVIRVAFEILWDAFVFKSKQQERDYRCYYDAIIDYFIHTPMVIGQTGTLFVKHHGIPSGSWFTSLIGSFCNYLMTVAAHKEVGASFFSMKCMGDDNITQYKQLPNVSAIAQQLRDLFGLVVNDDKTYAGPICGAKFLGRKFRRPEDSFSGDTWWYRDPSTTILQMMFPSGSETFDQMFIRMYALYLDNPSWWFYTILKTMEHHIDEAFEHQKEIDRKYKNGEYDKTYQEIELGRMIRMTSMVEMDYERLLKPPDLLRKLKSSVHDRLF